MNNLPPNPYESPRADEAGDASQQSYWGWRLIPAAGVAVLGCINFVLGLLLGSLGFVVWLRSAAWTNEDWWAVQLSGGMVFVGLAWMIAAWCYEHRRYRTALVATVAGFVPPAVRFLLL